MGVWGQRVGGCMCGGRGLVCVAVHGGQGVAVGGWWVYVWGVGSWWYMCGGQRVGVGGWVYVIVTNLIDKCIILVLSSLCHKMLTKQIHFVKKTS